MPYTYILRCADGTFYVGSTVDLQRRIDEHNLGLGSAYTRRPRRRPGRDRASATRIELRATPRSLLRTSPSVLLS